MVQYTVVTSIWNLQQLLLYRPVVKYNVYVVKGKIESSYITCVFSWVETADWNAHFTVSSDLKELIL